MKTLLTLLTLLLILVVMIGASLQPEKERNTVRMQRDCGYTIIEFGKGLNCHGDTVVLVKVPGGQKLATNTN